MRVSRILKDIYENFEKYFCAFLMALLVVCLGLQVFFRYVLQAALTWTEELSRFCFIWVIYLGTCVAAKEQQHVRVTAQFLLLPERFRIYQWILADVVWVIFNIVFAVQGVRLVLHMLKYPEITPSLGWSAAWIYAVIPLGFILMTLRIAQVYYRAFKDGTWRELARAGGSE
jgi:TRAP-type C4-dicarboxylate transport system permease small subunit